jgi:hypothetical protein
MKEYLGACRRSWSMTQPLGKMDAHSIANMPDLGVKIFLHIENLSNSTSRLRVAIPAATPV